MSDSAKVAMISTLDAARADVEALFQWLGFQRMEIAVLRSGACEVFHVSTAKEGLSWITQYERDCNIYFCTNEISPEHFGTNRRANAHDVTNPRVLLLDIDPAQVGLPPGRAFLAALAILPKVWEFDLRPLLINSGRGAQILFRIPNGADRVGTWQQFRDGYADVLGAYSCKLDSTYDPARLARMPGTVNQKTGVRARVIPQPGNLPRNLAATLAGKRPDLRDQSRSGYEMACASALALFGFGETEVETLLRAYPFGRGEAEHRSSTRTTARKAVSGKALNGNGQARGAAPQSENAKRTSKTKSQASVVVQTFEAEFCSEESSPTGAGGKAADPLFHTPGGVAYASIFINGHRETHALKSHAFRVLLAHACYKKNGAMPSSETVRSALAVLEGKALFDGPEVPVDVRVTEKDGNVYLDLADPQWRAIKITGAGQEIVTDPPVRFRRARGMLALPAPVSGGDFHELLKFFNIKRRADQLLVLSWMVAAFLPKGPYPILTLHGGQGSAKSTLGVIVRKLLDPSEAPLRTSPRDERDMMIAAANNHLLVFDNLSGILPWFSDALCRVASGGGLATRELFTDDEEIIFSAQRPIILNGIEEINARGDLLDRMILVELPPILKTNRRYEENFWREFEAARARIFGALLSVVSAVLRNLPGVKLAALPRMADFARVGVAAEQALGFESGEFMAAYDENIAEANRAALESSIVAFVIIDFLEPGKTWDGTARELLDALTKRAPENVVREKHWPKTPRGLTNAIARIEPNLATAGISITRRREGHDRIRKISLQRVGEEPSASSASSAGVSFQQVEADGGADDAGVPSAVSSAGKSSIFNEADGADCTDGGTHTSVRRDIEEGEL